MAGVIDPAVTVTLDVTVAIEVLLLLRVTVVLTGGAGVRRIWNCPACPFPSESGFRVMVPGFASVRLVEMFAIFGGRPAVIVVWPAATPVATKVTVLALAGIVTVAGTVATPVLLELRLRVMPPVGAVVDKVSVKVWVAVP